MSFSSSSSGVNVVSCIVPCVAILPNQSYFSILTHGPPFSLLLRVVPIQTRTPACPWHFPIERRRSPESPDAECISRNGCLLCLGACIKAGVENIILPKAKTQRDVIDSSDDDFAIGQQASS